MNSGRNNRHEAFNNLIKRATNDVPTIREPPECNRSDGKRPKKPLISDYKCANNSCQSHINSTCRRAGTTVNIRENATKVK